MTEFYSGDPGDEHCEHDWRINPHIMLPTYPPQRQLVCANCGKKKASGLGKAPAVPGRDPKTWEKWNGT